MNHPQGVAVLHPPAPAGNAFLGNSMGTQGTLNLCPAEPLLWHQPRVSAQPKHSSPSRNSSRELLSGMPSPAAISASLPEPVLLLLLQDFPAAAPLTFPSPSSPNAIRFGNPSSSCSAHPPEHISNPYKQRQAFVFKPFPESV